MRGLVRRDRLGVDLSRRTDEDRVDVGAGLVGGVVRGPVDRRGPVSAVLVQGGVYDESITMRAGVSIYGGLDATLEHIGADTITDDKGNAFYIVRVRTTQSTIGEAHMPIIPGMVAEVDILTGKKSLLSYLMKPVLRAKANALTER